MGVGVAQAPSRPQVVASEVKTKFFGRCLMQNGQVAVIVAKAASEAEASKKIHAGYTVSMVLELLTARDMERVWASMKPSIIQRSALT